MTVAGARPGHRVLGTRWFSVRVHVAALAKVACGVVVLALLAAWALTLGEYPVPIGDVYRSILGAGSPGSDYVLQHLRLPRVLLAILVGAALAISGAIFQGLVRNELVSPDIIGINTGAASIGLAWVLLTRDLDGLPAAMFTGAVGTAALIYAMAWKGGISPNRLILVGIGLQSVLGALDAFLVRRFPIRDVISADDMLLGSVSGAGWDDVSLMAASLTVLVPVALVAAGPLRVLQLGDDVARSVGLPVEALRLGLIALGCALVALSVSVSGLILFIALMIPHAARVIAGPMSASVMLLAGVLGAIALLAGDMIGQHLLGGLLPVTEVIGAVGAPYFVYLFWRSGARL